MPEGPPPLFLEGMKTMLEELIQAVHLSSEEGKLITIPDIAARFADPHYDQGTVSKSEQIEAMAWLLATAVHRLSFGADSAST